MLDKPLLCEDIGTEVDGGNVTVFTQREIVHDGRLGLSGLSRKKRTHKLTLVHTQHTHTYTHPYTHPHTHTHTEREREIVSVSESVCVRERKRE